MPRKTRHTPGFAGDEEKQFTGTADLLSAALPLDDSSAHFLAFGGKSGK